MRMKTVEKSSMMHTGVTCVRNWAKTVQGTLLQYQWNKIGKKRTINITAIMMKSLKRVINQTKTMTLAIMTEL